MNTLHCWTRVHIPINTFYLPRLLNKHHQYNVLCIKHQFKPKTASAITIYCAQNVVIWPKSIYALSKNYGVTIFKNNISFLTIWIDATCVQKDESRIKPWLYRQASVTKAQQASFYGVTELDPREQRTIEDRVDHSWSQSCWKFYLLFIFGNI